MGREDGGVSDFSTSLFKINALFHEASDSFQDGERGMALVEMMDGDPLFHGLEGHHTSYA